MSRLRLIALALAASSPFAANAHLFIDSPPPIAGSAVKDPLVGDGSNFPCHGVTFPGAGGTLMSAGSSQLLSFDTGGGYNTAVHGGGSCQISITYETDPVAIRDPSNWYVIASIEEGCPTNSPANLDGSYSGPNGTYTGSYLCNDTTTNGFDCVNQFQFTIPQAMMNGQATLAWTWFNTVGNREIYMNCAAIAITGGASDTSQMQTLPELFVANLQATDLPSTCSTTGNIAVAFPDPGANLQIKSASSRWPVPSATSSYPLVTPSGCPNNARVAVAASNTVSGSSSASNVLPSSASTSAAAMSSLISSAATSATSSPSIATIASSPEVSPASSADSSVIVTTQPSPTDTSASAAAVKNTSTKKSTTKKKTTSKKSTKKLTKKITKKTTKKTAKKTTKKPAKKTTEKTAKKTTKTTSKKITLKTSKFSVAATSIATSQVSTISVGATVSSATVAAANACPSGSVPCSDLDSLVCPDSGHFGICDTNNCAVSQAVAPGTECSNGQIVTAPSKRKRHLQIHRFW